VLRNRVAVLPRLSLFRLLPLRAAAIRAVLILFMGGQFVAPAFAQADSLKARDFGSLSAQANAARDGNRLDEAVALYQKALALRPRWAEGWWSLGTIEYDRDAYGEAARAFDKLIALDPKAGTAKVMLGLCEFELGNDASALQHIEEGKSIGIASDPQLRQVMLYHEGVLLERNGSFEAAREALATLCRDGVESDEVRARLGMVVLRLRAKDPPPNDTRDWEVAAGLGHAECLAAQKNFDEARRDYSRLAAKHPGYPNIHYAYGRFLLEVHDETAAVEEFRREIQNSPGHVPARLEIAAAEYRVDSARGLPYAEEAVKLDPNLPFGHYLLGLLLVDTKNYERAIPELEMAQRAFPQQAKVYFALASAYARAGRTQEAAQARETFLRLSQNEPPGSTATVYGQEPLGTAHEELGP
jgi:tetratricopeptide (TPR) repeat protein